MSIDELVASLDRETEDLDKIRDDLQYEVRRLLDGHENVDSVLDLARMAFDQCRRIFEVADIRPFPMEDIDTEAYVDISLDRAIDILCEPMEYPSGMVSDSAEDEEDQRMALEIFLDKVEEVANLAVDIYHTVAAM